MSRGAPSPLWAVVPAKGFGRGKSRLAPVLDGDGRAAFARGLLEHVLATLAATPRVTGVLVATDGDDVAAVARRHGAAVLIDEGAPEGGAGHAPTGPLDASASVEGARDSRSALARVVDAALVDVAARGARAALVLMADLPRLSRADVDQLVDALAAHDVALVGAADGTHTNALALAPPTGIATAFGAADSLARHLAAARAAGMRAALLPLPGVAFDVDSPTDHALLDARRADFA